MTKIQEIEINSQFQQALRLMEEGEKNLFITGKAGTGKSTLLKYFYENTKEKTIVLAPTGVAALNAKGQTIHSFFNFHIDITPEKIKEKKTKPKNLKLYKEIKTIIIDEISMVRADLLDCVDVFLRIYGNDPFKAFGGVQMIFIGDLYQLSPVVTSSEQELFRNYYETPYFFSAKVFENFKIEIIELEKIYRQKEQNFIELLNRIRNNSVNDEDIAELNKRYIKEVKQEIEINSENFQINLTTTNKKADEINNIHLEKLRKEISYYSDAIIEGDFEKKYFPTAEKLEFKVGAQIMLLNNDPKKQWVNGTVAIIKEVLKNEKDEEYLIVELEKSKKLVSVNRYTWEIYKFFFDGNTITSEVVGTFIQYPFRLAWAVTIHKSQGKTFENIVIDLTHGVFTTGQLYVALSRCSCFEGITLKTPIRKHHIRTDPRIHKFFKNY